MGYRVKASNKPPISSSPGISYFKLVDTGTSLYIQAHNDSNVKVCVDNDMLIAGASGVAEMQTSGSGTTGVKIYFDETDGDRWYLRVYLNSADEEVVELVSQSYVDNVSTDKHTQNVVDYRILSCTHSHADGHSSISYVFCVN